MIFDLDPHDRDAKFDIIRKMLVLFNDSSDKGKLFINYPMMQSFRHLRGMNDDGFKDRKTPIALGKRYKQLVGEESWTFLRQNKNLDRGIFKWIIEQHLMKFNYIVNGQFEMPTFNSYLELSGSDLFDRQHKLIEEEHQVYVINTSVLMVVDYRPSWFFTGPS